MPLITSLKELNTNLLTLEGYMPSSAGLDQQFHRNLIKNGVCFVAYTREGHDYFAPSRFIGYISNDSATHVSNASKDGRETNVAISKIIGFEPTFDANLDMRYTDFCTRIGVAANGKGRFGVERKFWKLAH